MRTVSFQSVLELTAQKLHGTTELGVQESATLTAQINEQLRECWEREAWPEWCPVEQRFYRERFGLRTTYLGGFEVYHIGTDAYWWAGEDTDNMDIPGTAGFWASALNETITGIVFRRYISLDQTAGETELLTPIGTVLGAYRSDPRVRTGAKPVDYILTPNGIEIVRFSGTSVWLHFRKRPPVFTSVLFDEEATYVVGQKVYFVGAAGAFIEGECYVCIEETMAGESPESEDGAPKWTKIEFPYVLKHAVADFVFADQLEEDGQTDRASKRREKAEEALALEWSKSESQQGIVRTFRVLTRDSVAGGATVGCSRTCVEI